MWGMVIFYIVLGCATYGVLYGIDKIYHKCTKGELIKERKRYIIGSIVWPFTLPISIIFVILSFIERMRGKEFFEKEEILARSSGIFFIAVIAVILWKLIV